MVVERPEGWLSKADSHRVEHLASRVSEIWKADSDPHAYTPHDPAHFRRVEQNIWNLIPAAQWKRLRPEERFLLSCAAWTHDIAMNAFNEVGSSRSTPVEIRRRHVEESAQWVIRHRRGLGLSHAEGTVLGEINLHHSRKYEINKCSKSRICNGVRVRPQLLAAYLRLADAMEVGHDRVDEWEMHRFLALQEAITNNADETLFHWIKSFVVSGIAPVPGRQKILVEFQIPETELRREIAADGKQPRFVSLEDAEQNEGFKLLMRFILEELREELETVEQVLSATGISTFHFVSPADDVIVLPRQSEPRWSSGLNRVVNYLRVAYSPNSSGTAQAALSSIADALRVIASRAWSSSGQAKLSPNSYPPLQKMEERKKVFEECGPLPQDSVSDVLSQLRRTLQTRLEARACHVELRRITEFVIGLEMELIHKSPIRDARSWLLRLDEYQNTMVGALDVQGRPMQDARELFWGNWKSERQGNAGKRLSVLCFGNSATVAELLVQFAKQGYERLFCYIGEGRPKTQHGARNVPTYLDAETYARTICERADKHGCKESIEIQIVPDIAIGTVLDPKHVAGRNQEMHPPVAAVVFGANGIFVNEDAVEVSIAHTCGHLAIAATARQLEVPVYVIAGAAKIHRGVPDGWQRLEREKSTEWIGSKGSGILSMLEEMKAVRLWNPREDHVPLSLLTGIITEFGICRSDDPKAAVTNLVEWASRFDDSLKKSAITD